jgi:UDP-GlcNAc3NAcA epimerase
MKIANIVGARPQFIKAAAVSRAIAAHNQHAANFSHITEIIIHTGQHYDHNMSRVFFDEMGIPEPHFNLGIGSGPHGRQTGEILIRIEQILESEKPDWVLVYGDTNSTLAGALASCKLHIPIAHVEAGLRSYNREMPEEYNRVLTDHCSDLLFCPSQTAIDNLKREGIERNVHLVGDTMYDAVLQFAEIALRRSTILQDLNLNPKGYLLATVHRPCNTDYPHTLKEIVSALQVMDEPVVFPIHPRTRRKMSDFGLLNSQSKFQHLHLIEPVAYLDMLKLQENARMILTDSGGIQKEAYFLGVPCVTLRPETEWVETVEVGWNVLAGSNKHEILKAVFTFRPPNTRPTLYGDGTAARAVVRTLLQHSPV